MPDISKCAGKLENGNCPLRDRCYRFTSEADPRHQSWIGANYTGDDCEDFWDLEFTVPCGCGNADCKRMIELPTPRNIANARKRLNNK